MRKAKLVCTLGPASESPDILEGMIRAGMDVARLNFSHGTHEQHRQRVRQVRAISKKLKSPVAILQDIQGPKIRLGTFENGQLQVTPGDVVTLTPRAVNGTAGLIPTSLPSLANDVKSGDPILLDDGRVKLEVLKIKGKDVIARVQVGGLLKDKKGLNLPGTSVSVPSITEKDEQDLAFGRELGVDYVALSFVRTAEDVRTARAILGNANTPIIAKIEKPQAVEALESIVSTADGIMVARGDLGVELPLERLPWIQKHSVATANRIGRTVIVATEMLESMIQNPRPTRAEVSDVANAILDGADAVMLSGETASGKYPVEAVATMARIVEEIEQTATPQPLRTLEHSDDISVGVAAAAVTAATQLGVELIVAYTESGYTARLLSRFRPSARILALTPNPEIVRRMKLYWGVRSLPVGRLNSTDAMVTQVRRLCQQENCGLPGSPVIIVAGVPLNHPGNTNLMTIHRI